MQTYIIRRLALLIPIVLAVTSMTFIMIHLIPGDPLAYMYMGNSAKLTTEQRAAIMRQLGLNDPLWVQYVRYMGNVLKGNIGNSIKYRTPVLDEIRRRLPQTMVLTASAMLIVVLVSLPLGIISALKRGTWLDTVVMVVALLGVSMPAFWFGIMLMLLFGLKLGWLPTLGQGRTPIAYLKSLVLPSVTLSMILLGQATRMVRSSMLEAMSGDYIRTAHAKGLRNSVVIYRHALKNAAIPILTVITGMIAALLGGTVIIETVFGWPGMGQLVVNASIWRDYQVVTGTVLVYTAIVILVNLSTDIVYAMLDPRIRIQ